MSRTLTILLVAAGALGACAAPSSGPLVGTIGAERYFRVEWQAGQSPRHGLVVQGSVYNTYGILAGNVRVLVEGLDASGQVASQTVGWVLGDVPSEARGFFEVPVSAPAASYRVTIFSYEWRARGA